MHASEKRIREDLESLALCTDGAGPGITRLTFSPAENRARSYLRGQMLQAGLRVRIDEAGNVIGRLDGRDESLPAVMAGSHIDSIRDGGNFDGMAGGVAGLETARIFRGTGLRPKRSIEIVGFTGEENSRFYPGQFGSRAMAGMDRLRAGLQGRGSALRKSPALCQAGLRYGPPASQNALLFGMFL